MAGRSSLAELSQPGRMDQMLTSCGASRPHSFTRTSDVASATVDSHVAVPDTQRCTHKGRTDNDALPLDVSPYPLICNFGIVSLRCFGDAWSAWTKMSAPCRSVFIELGGSTTSSMNVRDGSWSATMRSRRSRRWHQGLEKTGSNLQTCPASAVIPAKGASPDRQ